MEQSSKITIDHSPMFYRHNDLSCDRPGILFIHGIGESSRCFREAFEEPLGRDFNLLVPDLPGFGKSAAAANGDYCFTRQVERLVVLLDSLGIHRCHLVGHSMGGDIGTLFCQLHPGRIHSFVNIEGDLVAANRFIVDQVLDAEADARLDDWLRKDFIHSLDGLSQQWPSVARYLESLNLCDSHAFAASAGEIDSLLQVQADGITAKIGRVYTELSTPRVFCWGGTSLSVEAQACLIASGMEQQGFEAAFHWVMIDQPAAFYAFLHDWLSGQAN